MPKIIPVPDDLSKPFWDAVNQHRLMVQHCIDCNTLQFPPRLKCQDCSSDKLDWKDTSGRGHILTYSVSEDTRLQRRVPDQPFNIALIALDDDPRINFYSNLPGVPVKEVPIGAPVEVVFEELAPDQLIPEWKLTI